MSPVARARHQGGALVAHLRTPLFRNGYSLLVGSGATSVLGIAYWALAARYATPAEVGLGAALISMLLLVSGVGQLGLHTVFHRFLPLAGPGAGRLIVRAYGISAAVSAAAALAVAVIAGRGGSAVAVVGSSAAWIAAFAAMAAAWSVFMLQDSVMTGLRQAHWVPLENTIFAAAKIALLIPLAAAAGASGVFFSWTIPAAVAIVPITLLIFGRLLPGHLRTTADAWVPLDRGLLLRTAWSNHLGTMFAVASLSLLPIIVTTIGSSEENAYFYIAWAIASGLQLVSISMSISMLVESSLEEPRMVEHARRILRHSLRLLLPVVAAIAIAAPWLLRVFGSDYATEGAWALRLLVVSTLPALLVTIAINIARVRHDAVTVVGAQAATCTLGVGLGAAFLPAWGITGVAAGWLTGQVLVALALTPGLVRTLGRVRPR